MSQEKFRRTIELDGLRGLAVLLVLIVHSMKLGPNAVDSQAGEVAKLVMDFGWAGVELFFVLSGFLITSLMLNGPAREGWMKAFYIKRFFRIIPALFVTLVIIFAVAGYFSIGVYDDFDVLYGNIIYYLILSPNLLAVDLISECQSVAALAPQLQQIYARPCMSGWHPATFYIGHLWTIAVEIHFYLLWPLIVLVFRRSPKKLILFAGFVIVATLVWRVVFWQYFDSAAIQGNDWAIIYTNTSTRIDSLFIGVFIALLLKLDVSEKHLSRFKLVATVAFIVFILTSVYLDGRVSPFTPPVFTIGFSVICFFFAALVLHLYTNSGKGKLTAVFRTQGLRTIGQYSYAIYLIHQPLMYVIGPVFRQYLGPHLIWQLVFLPFMLLLCVGVAKLFWILIENPSISYGNKLANKTS